jgi:hypothetical protein
LHGVFFVIALRLDTDQVEAESVRSDQRGQQTSANTRHRAPTGDGPTRWA